MTQGKLQTIIMQTFFTGGRGGRRQERCIIGFEKVENSKLDSLLSKIP